jgi:hypothetical protein
MLKTKLTGELVPDFDAKVVEFINSYKFNNPDDHFMVIGIDNHKDKVYRVIEVTGADEYVLVTDFLESLIMLDVLMLGIRTRSKGFDSRFRLFQVTDSSKFSHILATTGY